MARVDAVLDRPLLQQPRQEGAREGVARAVPVHDRLRLFSGATAAARSFSTTIVSSGPPSRDHAPARAEFLGSEAKAMHNAAVRVLLVHFKTFCRASSTISSRFPISR